jgi:hypothetical protein
MINIPLVKSVQSCLVFQGGEASESCRGTRLRNDSYLGAIHRENLLVRAGLQVCYLILVPVTQ